MRQILAVVTALLSTFSLFGFSSGWQAPNAQVTVFNRAGQAASQITDGDTIRLQITLSQALTEQAAVTFTVGNQSIPAASCIIPAGSSTCKTDDFHSLGWHWDAGGVAQSNRVIQAYDTEHNLLGESEALVVLPRPVVMVHGFLSAWDTWQPYLGPDGYLASLGLRGFALGDGQVPGVLNTGSITNPTQRTNTIAQNAEIEAQYIAGVKKLTGAEMVDLAVHSMGGMISRYYIDRVMQERDVAQLIMLGSPMGGSDCAVLPAALGFYLPGSLEIRQSYMQGIFNRQITHRHGVEFYDLGGTAILEAFKSPCTNVPNDTVVSFDSINAIPLQSEKIDVIHSDLTMARPVFDEFVRPRLERIPGSFSFAADPEPAPAKSEALQFTRVYTGRVAAGGSTELTIHIDPNVSVASFALFDPTRSVTVSVRGASGNVIQLNADTNGLIQVDDPAALFYLGYGFQNPKPGQWQVTVLATSTTPASGADFSISAYFIGGATLNAQSSTLVPQINEPVQFTASLSLNGQPLEIQQAQAVIRGEDGKVETLDFSPGAQLSTSWTPATVGVYGVDIVVAATAPDGSPIERTAFLAVDVQPNPSTAQVKTNLTLLIGGICLALGLIGLVGVWALKKLLQRKK